MTDLPAELIPKTASGTRLYNFLAENGAELAWYEDDNGRIDQIKFPARLLDQAGLATLGASDRTSLDEEPLGALVRRLAEAIEAEFYMLGLSPEQAENVARGFIHRVGIEIVPDDDGKRSHFRLEDRS